MGRNAMPIEMMEKNNKKEHVSKAQIAKRKASQIKTGVSEIKCPPYIHGDAIAYKKWKETIAVFKDTALISSGDVTLIGLYCTTWSEYMELYLERNSNELLDIKLETLIEKKINMLIKMQDRLFLNPLAKIKNIPKTAPETVDPLEDKFGDI